jgi:uncharacterized membrane protein
MLSYHLFRFSLSGRFPRGLLTKILYNSLYSESLLHVQSIVTCFISLSACSLFNNAVRSTEYVTVAVTAQCIGNCVA